jgi:dihydrofolate reductase
MARLIFGMIQSLDGYIVSPTGSPQDFPPGPKLFRHFLDHVSNLTGMLYGTRIYQVMRYWEQDHPEWSPIEHEYAAAWRSKPKWLISRSLKTAGPNATIVTEDLQAFATRLRTTLSGEIDVAGAELAGSLTALNLIDEYRLYLRPLVFGGGKPYFAAARPQLQLVKSDSIGEDATRIICVPF